MNTHSKFAASASHIWINCPGSHSLTAGLPGQPPSPYMIRGTVAHEIGEKYLKNGIALDSWTEMQGVTIDNEIIDAVRVYTDYCEDLRFLREDAAHYEQHLVLESVRDDLWGTADFILADEIEKHLYIVDYKNGFNFVEVNNNPQLAYYALAALDKFGNAFNHITMAIVQPNSQGQPIREWTVALEPFKTNWIKKIKRAVRRCENETDVFISGEHCQWCRGKPICPKLYEETLMIAGNDFDDLTEYPKDLDRVIEIAEKAKELKSYIDSCVKFLHEMLEAGETVPGWKLVAKRSVRKWRNEKKVIRALSNLGLDNNQIYTPGKLLSPAQIEKVLKAAEINPSTFLNKYSEKPDTGSTLAKEDDRREALAPSAERDFSDHDW